MPESTRIELYNAILYESYAAQGVQGGPRGGAEEAQHLAAALCHLRPPAGDDYFINLFKLLLLLMNIIFIIIHELYNIN